MTDAAVADPSLTVGELVDKTKQKLEYMSAYMEGASRMVGFEGALASRAGDDHRRVLEHAAKLLEKSEEFLQDRAAEAGAAASGAPFSGSAAPSSDARLLEGIDAFMGKASTTKAEDQDDPMEGPPKKEESSSEELVPDEAGRAHKSATRVPRQFRAATHVAPPPATMAACSDEDPSQPRGLTACMCAGTVGRASTRRFAGPSPSIGPSSIAARTWAPVQRQQGGRILEAKEARKQAALAAIQASLLVGGWLCPGCNEWNLSFRNLCYRCNGKRTAAGVLSRGIPDPTRDQQDRDESDSDDSAAIELRREQEEDLEETVKPFLRSTRAEGQDVAQERGSVLVWLRPLAAALAWCATFLTLLNRDNPCLQAQVSKGKPKPQLGRPSLSKHYEPEATSGAAVHLCNKLMPLRAEAEDVSLPDGWKLLQKEWWIPFLDLKGSATWAVKAQEERHQGRQCSCPSSCIGGGESRFLRKQEEAKGGPKFNSDQRRLEHAVVDNPRLSFKCKEGTSSRFKIMDAVVSIEPSDPKAPDSFLFEARASSSSYSLSSAKSASTAEQQLESLSVSVLRAKVRYLGAEPSIIARCIEKRELVSLALELLRNSSLNSRKKSKNPRKK
ncbi:hypothetical protein AK812_SmicGene31441 [Symbiodinium microadriaticum]|uniref:RanBP2-type domain-containing protein n=1 Tax=Symbiodinium microadriaticum TaxID=2951 RepID=A0A1Q9CWS0_SYMMI|nr:hypothetical protein AK812_SmicGene31441 [Symbiodinium microadriaticum]